MFRWMTEDKSVHIDEVRRDYARRIAALAGIDQESVIGKEVVAAFETVPRENLVGPPPWRIFSPGGQSKGISSDPVDLYQDVLITLNGSKGLNNGQPSLHALCLNAVAPQKGERAIHVGAGTGYYTAILAKLVSESGRVDAYEIDAELAQQATTALKSFQQVAVHGCSGSEGPLPKCDVIYVSAACAEPLSIWLDALHCGGRLLLPLEPERLGGQMLLVVKQPEQSYSARFLCGVQFVTCIGAQDPHAARELEAAFRRGKWEAVRSLHRKDSPDESCWCAGHGWWLSTR